MKPFIQSGAEVRQLHSHIINQSIQLIIKLPCGCKRRESSNPVLYCLDADPSLPLYSILSFASEKPGFTAQNIIIVGISPVVEEEEHTSLFPWMTWGMQDLLSQEHGKMSAIEERLSSLYLGRDKLSARSTGAHRFLRSLKEEIVPFIEANFPTSSAGRGLAGSSDAGFFTLYTLFTETSLFERYYAGSPTTFDRLFEYESDYAASHADLNARLLLTASSEDPESLEFLRCMAASLQARMYPGFTLLPHLFEDESDFSAYIASVGRALMLLYEAG